MSSVTVIARSPIDEMSKGWESNSAVESALTEAKRLANDVPRCFESPGIVRGESGIAVPLAWQREPQQCGSRRQWVELRADQQFCCLQRSETICVAGSRRKCVVGVQGVVEVDELLRPARHQDIDRREKVGERLSAATSTRSPIPKKADSNRGRSLQKATASARKVSTFAMICARFVTVSASSGASVALTNASMSALATSGWPGAW